MNAFIKKLSLVFFASLCLSYLSPAVADEAITNYVSNIYLNNNGSADISEKITVRAEHKKVLNGIVRWLPRFYRDKAGNLTQITYSITDVLADNLPTPYHLITNEKRIGVFVGSTNRQLPPGIYTFLIQYHINNAAILGTDNDQFYWNVTSGSWLYPIENVDATIYLPKGATVERFAGYTGTMGHETHNYFVSSPLGSNQINYASTEPLAAGEELTVGISWPKGFIYTVSLAQNSYANFLSEHGYSIAALILLGLILYYVMVWRRETFPRLAPLAPLFAPPESLSAVDSRYIQNMAYDDQAFTVAVVSLAVKGYLVMQEEENGIFTLTKKTGAGYLSRAEQSLLDCLFLDTEALELSARNFEHIQCAQIALKKNLRDEYEKTYFVSHASFLIPGFLIGFLGIVALAFASHDIGDVLYLGAMLNLAALYLPVQMPRTCEAIRGLAIQPAHTDKVAMVGRLTITMFLVVVIAIAIPPIAEAVSTVGTVLITCIILTEVLFYHLLKQHTPLGHRLMDQVSGFKAYLANSTVSAGKKVPPTKTVDLFEKYLPYAIALEVTEPWAEQFAEVLTKSTPRQHAYSPVWYVGPGNVDGHLKIAIFMSSLNSGLGGTVVRRAAENILANP
jgi:hypothetical protein